MWTVLSQQHKRARQGVGGFKKRGKKNIKILLPLLLILSYYNKMKIKQNELKVLLGTDLGFPENIVNSVTCDFNTIERPTEFLKHNKESNKI